MAILKIAQLGEPVLREPARALDETEIGSEPIQRLIADMVETMRDANGAGLAAPQVYRSLQLCVIEVGENPRYPAFPAIELRVLINPRLTPLVSSHDVLLDAESISMYEGCLSVSGLRGRVTRPRKVRLRALDDAGRAIDEVWEGVPAAIVQHEVDHLHATLLVDRADPGSLCFLREYDRHVPSKERIVDGLTLPDGSAGPSRIVPSEGHV